MGIQPSSLSALSHGTFLDRQIQRTNRNLLMVGLFLIVAVVGYATIERRYLYNFFAGPFPVSGPQLVTIQQPGSQLRYFVQVKGDDSSDTGLQEVERETQGGTLKRETVKAKYSILLLNQHLLIVKSDPNESGMHHKAKLSRCALWLRRMTVTKLRRPRQCQYVVIERTRLPGRVLLLPVPVRPQQHAHRDQQKQQ